MSDDLGTDNSNGGNGSMAPVVAVSNVVPIAKKKGKGAKPTTMDQIMDYVDSLLDEPMSPFELPARFKTLRDEQRQRIQLEVLPGDVVRAVSKQGIADLLMEVSKRRGGLKPLDPEHAAKAVKFWSACDKALRDEDVKVVAEKSEPGLCWHRLPWDLAPGETPYFDEMFSRIDNGPALREWLGSLLVADSSRQHYVWLHGQGLDGKGALINFIARVFGPGFRSETAPEKNERRFWTYGLIGARIVAMPEGDNHFITTGLFKSLTGDDPVRVEEKGGAISTVKMTCKVLIASNDKPKISGQKADTRRIIYCEYRGLSKEPSETERNVYADRLWQEGSAFLWKCRKAYADMIKSGRGYTLNTAALDALIASNEEDLQVFFDSNFVIGSPDDFVLPAQMRERFGVKHWNKGQIDTFYKWMERKYGIRASDLKDDGRKTFRAYRGIMLANNGARAEGHDGRY